MSANENDRLLVIFVTEHHYARSALLKLCKFSLYACLYLAAVAWLVGLMRLALFCMHWVFSS